MSDFQQPATTPERLWWVREKSLLFVSEPKLLFAGLVVKSFVCADHRRGLKQKLGRVSFWLFFLGEFREQDSRDPSFSVLEFLFARKIELKWYENNEEKKFVGKGYRFSQSLGHIYFI